MCGIVGVMGDFKEKKNTFNFLLQVDAVRGWDSTGMLSVNGNDMSVAWYKDTVLPQELISSPEYLELAGMRIGTQKKIIDPLLLMGHNRAATKGSVTIDNAHPFAQEHIFLTHNGTIHNLYPLTTQIEDKFDTDSETLTRVIAEKGVDKAWPAMTGAASIAYYNSEAESLNLISNGDRPLFFLKGKDEKFIVYASELWMLHAAAHKFDIPVDKYHSLVDNTLHIFTYNSDTKTVPMEMTALKKYEPPAYSYGKKWDREPWYGNQRAAHHSPQCSTFVPDPYKNREFPLFPKMGKRKRKRLERVCRAKVRQILKSTKSFSMALDKLEEHKFRGEPELTAMMRDAIWDHFFKKKPDPLKLVSNNSPTDWKGTVEDHIHTKGYGFARDDMTEEEFAAVYGKTDCIYCGDSLVDEYETAVILDSDSAICGNDAKIASDNNMALAFVI